MKRASPDLQRDWDSDVQPACPAPGGELRGLLDNFLGIFPKKMGGAGVTLAAQTKCAKAYH